MLKDYVLGAEIAQKAGFSIVNVSLLLQNDNFIEGEDYFKFGVVTLINKNSDRLPKYFRAAIAEHEYTDLSELLPMKYFNDMLEGCSTKIKDKYRVKDILGKKFVEIIDKDFKDIIMDNKKVKSVVQSEEIPELQEGNYIDGCIALNKSKYLCWY
jgi:hypothetical protein